MKYKYLERRLANAGIMIFKEKHHTRYFICNNSDDYCRVAMKILKERVEQEWYWDEEDDTSNNNEGLEYLGQKPRKQRHVPKDKTEAQQIITDNDLEEAFVFIDRRSDWEYEGMEIEHPETY